MSNLLLFLFLPAILFGIMYQLVSLSLIRKKVRKKRVNEMQTFPLVSILKPLKGLDEELEENLESFFKLSYPNYELIFALDSFLDSAFEVAERLIKSYPGVIAKIIVEDNRIGLNPKVNNLQNAYVHAHGEIIYISDSNTRVEKDFLDKILPGFNNSQTGLISATIRGIKSKNIFAAMENIHLAAFAAPSIEIADRFADIQIVIGKAILIRTNVLEKIGGFFKLSDYLSEDHIMGMKVKEAGYEVKNSAVTVDNININWTLKKLLNRHIRWYKMRANITFHYYIFEPLTNPIVFALILSAVDFNPVTLSVSLLTILLKLSIDYLIALQLRTDMKFYHFLLIPLKDLLMLTAWASPIVSRRINWRGNKFSITKNSRLYIKKHEYKSRGRKEFAID
ncbi:MAG: glycosyltransferase [Ignavibacteriaceae bacterium]